MGGLRLNLGAGSSPIEGYLSVDQRKLPWIDQVVDLNILPWPWKENSVEKIIALDVLEHLYPLGKHEGQLNIVRVLEEVHRVLQPGGELLARIPSSDSRGAFQDPTHVTYWNPNTWWYFDVMSDLRPPNWPPFEVDTRLETEWGPHCEWVLVKARKVSYDKVEEVRKNAQHTVDPLGDSSRPESKNPPGPQKGRRRSDRSKG